MNCVKSLLVASMISSSVIAKVECKPFVDEKEMVKIQVEDFSTGVSKLIAKINKLEEKLNDKQFKIDSLSSQAQEMQSQMQTISLQISDIRKSSQGAQDQLSAIDNSLVALSNRISQIEYTLQGSVSSTTRRNLNREKMRKLREMDQLQADKVSLVQVVSQANAQIEPLRAQRMAIKSQRDMIEQDLMMEQTAQPTIALLQDKIQKEQILLGDSQAMETNLLAQLDEAREKVLMCRTYNVKYPLVLSIASEIAAVGCQNYEIKNFNSDIKLDAQAQILESLCPVN